MYVGTMHGYALDLLQRLVPETFKFSVLTEITSRMLVDRNSRKSGLTVCPTTSSGTPYLRRFLHSRLFLQATSVLREDAVDWDLVPAGVVSSFENYMKLLYEHAYFDFTEMINLAVQFLEGDADDDESAGMSSSTSATTSDTLWSTSTRTSTHFRSAWSAASLSSARTCVSLATMTRRSTSGVEAKSPTSSPLRTATPASGR